jgi:hypothetical protein
LVCSAYLYSENEDICYFHMIPSEIMDFIFEFFDAKKLAAFRVVCKSWKEIVSQVPVQITLENVVLSKNYSGITSSFNNIQELRLATYGQQLEESRAQLIQLLQHCTKLSKIYNPIIKSFPLSHLPNPELVKSILLRDADCSIAKMKNLEDLQ